MEFAFGETQQSVQELAAEVLRRGSQQRWNRFR